jgi:hypothetical protein
MAACIMLLGPLLHAFEFSGRRLQRRYPANGAICDTRLHGVLAREHVLCVDYAAARSIYIFDPACPTHQLITTNPPLCILILPRLASHRIASRLPRTGATLLRHTCTASSANTRNAGEGCDNAPRRSLQSRTWVALPESRPKIDR